MEFKFHSFGQRPVSSQGILKRRLGWGQYAKVSVAYLALAGIVIPLNTACTAPSQNTATTRIDSTPSIPIEGTPQGEQDIAALNVAMIPSRSSEDQAQKRRRLADYLQKQLGLPVNIQITEDYETTIDLLVNGQIEMAFLGGFAYVKAKQRNPNLEPIVAPIEEGTGRPWYNSVMVTSTHNEIDSVEDLKGSRFSFVSESSTSGFLAPYAHFKEMGIEPEEDFVSIHYAGSHNKNIDALVAGKVDAISVNKPTYLEAQQSGKLPVDQYTAIWESDPIPNSPIVISSQLPSQLKIELQKALINAPEGLVSVSGAISAGYTLVQDEDYDIIRRLQTILEPN